MLNGYAVGKIPEHAAGGCVGEGDERQRRDEESKPEVEVWT